MRAILGCTAATIFLFAAGSSADDKKEEKIDGAKLIGKWERKDAKKESAFTLEFAKDGKLIVGLGKDSKNSGTYKLDGNKLTVVLKVGENEIKDTLTITKLTDEEFEAESGAKKAKDIFLRVKEK
jgi:uncharacterized protein (TIGR03066 family)